MIYLFLADGFEEIEALATVDVIRRAGLEVETVGVTSQAVRGSHNITVMADRFINEVEPNEELQAVILPGGLPGTTNLEQSRELQHLLSYAYRHNRILAAICAAPSILGHNGFLKGKTAICYPGYEKDLLGAEIATTPVCRSGNIITAAGAGVSIDFGAEIVAAFCGREKADSIKEKMRCTQPI